ncbi:MAG: NADH-quinone oxidoreductase subunit NuoE [Armatimonadota bacterium]|nr:NADH-quinone oxidoreductase subunit NuoE [Armatimonadota bacterium]MCX7777168.1 NADH-quinone oxidoreductase subunit NuoE [Armatimonadota bacterium]MDW8024995.1 NADH-quinone oxidoreductase subunit NuoE [Armatimonadota bacterium]
MELIEEKMEERVDRILSCFSGRREELIVILQRIQDEFGYLPEFALIRVAKFLGVPEAHVYGVASFYAQFRFKPMGKNVITVCRGTACHVRGSPMVIEEVKNRLGIEEGDTTPDLRWTLETVACIGMCALAPCVIVNGKVHGKVTPRRIAEIIKAVEGVEKK